MTLGERCDEIVRLIDETLGSLGPDAPAPAREVALAPAPPGPEFRLLPRGGGKRP